MKGKIELVEPTPAPDRLGVCPPNTRRRGGSDTEDACCPGSVASLCSSSSNGTNVSHSDPVTASTAVPAAAAAAATTAVLASSSSSSLTSPTTPLPARSSHGGHHHHHHHNGPASPLLVSPQPKTLAAASGSGGGGGGGGSGFVMPTSPSQYTVCSTNSTVLPPPRRSVGISEMVRHPSLGSHTTLDGLEGGASQSDGQAGPIHAPTPLYRLSYRSYDDMDPATPKNASTGSEIEAILAEKGKTGENQIRQFPRITSCEEFGVWGSGQGAMSGGMRRAESLCDVGPLGCQLSRTSGCASPLGSFAFRSGGGGGGGAFGSAVGDLSALPNDFPAAAGGQRSYLDLAALGDAEDCCIDTTHAEHDNLLEPPARSSNPLKSLLSSPRAKAASCSATLIHLDSLARKQPRPYGAELGLNTLSPAFS